MWIDITQTLKKGMPNWPGDTPFSFELSYSKEQTGSVNIGRMETSMHTGTHADAPFHFDSGAPRMEQLDVNIFIGDAYVADCTGVQEIGPEHMEDIDFQGAPRLLLKTVPSISETFPMVIPVIKPELAGYLKERGVFLLGVDNPSVDSIDSKQVAAHHALYQNGITIVEGLVLEQVAPGLYDFIALPLKVEGADGAPVRAVIRKK